MGGLGITGVTHRLSQLFQKDNYISQQKLFRDKLSCVHLRVNDHRSLISAALEASPHFDLTAEEKLRRSNRLHSAVNLANYPLLKNLIRKKPVEAA